MKVGLVPFACVKGVGTLLSMLLGAMSKSDMSDSKRSTAQYGLQIPAYGLGCSTAHSLYRDSHAANLPACSLVMQSAIQAHIPAIALPACVAPTADKLAGLLCRGSKSPVKQQAGDQQAEP